MTTAFPYTTEFHQEFQAETATLLRRRFIWFAAIAGGLTTLQLLMRGGMLLQRWVAIPGAEEASTRWHFLAGIVHDAATVLLYAGVLVYARFGRVRQHELLRLSSLCIVLDGTLDVALATSIGASGSGVFTVIVAHCLAAALLPWSPRQAISPMVPVLVLNAAAWLIWSWNSITAVSVVGIMLTPAAAVPGAMIAYAKYTRRTEQFKLRFLQSRYGMIRRELVDARRIHEALFPHPIRTGPLRFDYRYEPMLQIGGDYLYARFSPPRAGEPPAFNVILIDVTGHGIAAALTVNRLYGEVERLFAEQPHALPGDLLRALNRYVHLTLARHGVYATALCMRIDLGRGQVEFASGGHPPAFLRAVDGTIDLLGATAVVLGAQGDDEFDPTPEHRQFGPGDALIAYTDGAIEARNDIGKVLGIRGLMGILAAADGRSGKALQTPGAWIDAILAAVEGHRVGPPRDDTIVVEIARTLTADAEPRRSTTIQITAPAAPASA